MDEALHTIVIVDIHPTEPASTTKPHQSNAMCTCGKGFMWVDSSEIRNMALEHSTSSHNNRTNIVRYS